MNKDLFPGGPVSSAVISECGRYRYRLDRVWDHAKPRLAVIMLNPSTADASNDDPTIRRCVGFAKDWGYGGIAVGNLFALRSTHPEDLYKVDDPVGPENDAHLAAIATECGGALCAWGTHGAYRDRGFDVARTLAAIPIPLRALTLTASGQPGHPLYVARNREPFEFSALAVGAHEPVTVPAHLPRLALSIRQPWVHCILHLGKPIENRDWDTSYRGPVCLHASKGMTRDEYEDCLSLVHTISRSHPFPDGGVFPALNELPRGGIVGTAEIVDVVRESDSPWFFGRFGLVLSNPKPVEFIPVKGQLGFFDWRRNLPFFKESQNG